MTEKSFLMAPRFTRYLDYFFKCRSSRARRGSISSFDGKPRPDFGEASKEPQTQEKGSKGKREAYDDIFEISPTPSVTHDPLRMSTDSISDFDELNMAPLENPLRFSQGSASPDPDLKFETPPSFRRKYSSGSPNILTRTTSPSPSKGSFPKNSLESLINDFYSGDLEDSKVP